MAKFFNLLKINEMGISQYFFLRQRGTGLPKITLRVVIDGLKKDISTGFACAPEDWDERQFRLKKRALDYEKANRAIDVLREKTHKAFAALSAIEKPSFADFDAAMNGKPIVVESFYDWATEEIEKMKPVISKGTLKHYNAVITKLKKFRPTLQFVDFDPEFVLSYRNYMFQTLENRINTVDSNFKKLKRLIAIALQQGKITESPFRFYRSKKEASTRVFLSLDEVKALDTMFWNDEFVGAVENVTRNFLFCCYTGIRYGDLADLTWDQINEDYVELKMNKTKEYVRIPLVDRAKKLLPKDKKKMVFRVPANQVTNRFLKEMAKQAGFDKDVTSHTGRHTFATLGMTLGIPIEVISKILGHSDLKTTQIYAKIIDAVKDREMKKFDNF